MENRGSIHLCNKHYAFLFEKSDLVSELIQHLPISSIANNIGGEIYFRVPGVELEYDGTQSEEFEIGDIVYWRSPDGEKKFSIAMMYGNTQYSNWKSPRTSSPCIKIGSFVDSVFEFGNIDTGESVTISIE